jgi:hypothetical protein
LALAEAADLGAFFGADFLALGFAAGAVFAACVEGLGAADAGFVAATAGDLACVAADGALVFAVTGAAGLACGCGAGLVVAVAGLACACKPEPAAPSKIPSARVFTERINSLIPFMVSQPVSPGLLLVPRPHPPAW